MMQTIEFIVDGNALKGILIFPEKLKEKNPAVLFVHGWTSMKERSIQYAQSLAKLGYVSLLFDMRGHGESEGDLENSTTKEFLNDVLAAYDYLMNMNGVDRDDISVKGSSFGSYLSALLTTKRRVKRLALRVPADYPNEFFDKSKMKTSGGDNPAVFAWRSQARNSDGTFALEAMARFDGRILIIESEKDTVVPHQTVQNYIDAVKDKRKLTHIVIPGAPHSIKEGPFKDAVEKVLIEWFGSHART